MKKQSKPSKNYILKDFIGIKLSSTLLTMKRHLVRSFESNKAKLSFEEWMNLLPLIEHEGITQNQLANFLGKDKTNISRLVAQWKKKGLITTQKKPDDMRAIQLRPTEKALLWHNQALHLVAQADLVFCEDLSAKEVQALLMVLNKINTSVLRKAHPA